MDKKAIRIDLVKLILYILERAWIIAFCAELGFGAMFWYANHSSSDTFTASGTLYVTNGEVTGDRFHLSEKADFEAALALIDQYKVVLKSQQVMEKIVDYLDEKYPGINAKFILTSLKFSSVSESGLVSVKSTTDDPVLSTDIANAVIDIAPEELLSIMQAGTIKVVDYAIDPVLPDAKDTMRKGMMGAMAGAVAAGGVLFLLFLMNSRVHDTKEMTELYVPPILASIRRIHLSDARGGSLILSRQSDKDVIAGYSTLRANLLHALNDKESNIVVVTSAIQEEGKTTIAANLAIFSGMTGKQTLLIDANLESADQSALFGIEPDTDGLSDVLNRKERWFRVIHKDIRTNLDLLPAGHYASNSSELLSSVSMKQMLKEAAQEYDLVLIDMPAVNTTEEPFIVAEEAAGCLIVVRQNFSDHREVGKALISAEITGMDVLGFVFYGEKLDKVKPKKGITEKKHLLEKKERKRLVDKQKLSADSSANEAAQAASSEEYPLRQGSPLPTEELSRAQQDGTHRN